MFSQTHIYPEREFPQTDNSIYTLFNILSVVSIAASSYRQILGFPQKDSFIGSLYKISYILANGLQY